MSGRGLKRKIDSECRVFNEKWSLDYFVIYSGDKIICLICKESISVLKEYNIRRHYETKHKTTFSKFTEKLRLDKLQSLQNNFSSQQLLFKKQKNINEAATKASFRISHLLAKRGKAFSDGSLIKECIIQAVEEICPERIDTFKNISLSANTVARRIDDISNNLNSQVSNKTQEFISFSIALDESTDVCDTSQLLLFIRGVNKDLEISNELLSVHSMHGTTTGIDIFKVIEKSFLEYNLKWENLKCITTDGGRNMCGTKKGLIGQIFTNCEKEGFQPMTLHCIIHQQALCGKTLDLSCVMDPIISTVNFIRSSALRHRQFQDFLKEIETEYPDIPYFTAVRWLSRGKVLSRFFELRNEIEIFLIDKNRPLPLLTDSEWVWKLAFLVDITKYMNDFNLKLQGKDVLICDVYTLVKAFRQKLILFETQISKNCFIHFSTCDKYNKESRTQFPVDFAQKIISELKIQFKQRFSDLDVKSEEINIFQNPFSCDIEKLPPTLQMEMIDLQSNDALKIKHREETLVDFYKFLPDIQYPNLKKFAIEYISVFATTYLCEQTFSKMKYIKSKYRSAMTDKHLESILKIGTSNIQPQFDRILAEKHQFHTSH